MRYLMAVLTAFACAVSILPNPKPSAPEYNIKAGYVLLFTKFVEWPKEVFPFADTPLVIAVLGADPFGNILDETFRNMEVQGRKVKVMRARNASEALKCHLVFISRAETDRISGWLDSIDRKGVLSVTETGTESPSGAVINFVMENNHLRFDVDMHAMERSGLKISSPMLVSARKIHDGTGGP